MALTARPGLAESPSSELRLALAEKSIPEFTPSAEGNIVPEVVRPLAPQRASATAVTSAKTRSSPSPSPATPTLSQNYPAHPRQKSARTWQMSGRERPTPAHTKSAPVILHARHKSVPTASMSSTTTIAQTVETPTRAPSLYRKLSNKLRRRRSSNSRDTEDRSGPVVMRHRNGSVSGGIGSEGNPGTQRRGSDGDTIVRGDQLDGTADAPGSESNTNGTTPSSSIVQHDGRVGIIVPQELQEGTAMTRVTRKKRTQRVFKLDVERGRVTWNPSKPSSRFDVDDLRDVRTGHSARNYREELQISAESEDRWITITYVDPDENGKLKLLHVIAPTVELFEMWTTTLEAIHKYRTEMMAGLATQGENSLAAQWLMATRKPSFSTAAELPKEQRVTFEDVERTCRNLQINCSRRFLKEKFKRADINNSGYLNFAEFRHFVTLLKEREEIDDLWKRAVAEPFEGMTEEEFRVFLRDVQRVDVDADAVHVHKVFRKFCRKPMKQKEAEKEGLHHRFHRFHHGPSTTDDMRMSKEAFAEFLFSPSYNPPLLTAPVEGITLDRPLNEYYCSSSHNTYLMGRQVRGQSSVEGYIRVLQRGCRCLEIDAWDGDDGRPVVTHGRTGTSEILFADVIAAISKYAFVASPYPVILSLEVHCGLEQQVKMADIMKSVLGEKLVTETFIPRPLTLPSPEELKHRFIIKVKGSNTAINSSQQLVDLSSSLGDGIAPLITPGRSTTSSSSGTSESTSESDGGVGGTAPKRQTATKKIAPELGALGVYCRGQKFRNFALPESKTFNHCFSFGEKKFLRFCKEHEKKLQLEKHNVRYLMRVYPSGFRVNSSNFDPLAFWRRGVQMVALNWQTYDVGLQLNEAMFAAGTDKSGYVLKPQTLRGSRHLFEPDADPTLVKLRKEKKEINFSIEVISAQQLARPRDRRHDESIDPFVEVEVFTPDDKSKGVSTGEGGIDTGDSKGISGLGAPQKRKTAVVRDNGFHPVFKEKMRFKVVTKFEDLVFVRFAVYHADGDSDKLPIATYTAKLISLQQGYRHLPLFDHQGEQFLFSTLFVKINVDNPVVIERDIPALITTMDTVKSTARYFLSRGKSLRRKKEPAELKKEAKEPPPQQLMPGTPDGVLNPSR